MPLPRVEWAARYLDGEWDPFTTAFRVTPALAQHMLDTTAYRMSKFNGHCPVAYKERCDLVDVPSYPVVYRRHVYFCESKEAADKLVTAPEPYIRGPPAPPFLAGSCAVLGPPCSGVKSTARAIAQEHGRVYICPATAVKLVLAGVDCQLRREVMEVLHDGEDLEGELLARCIGAVVRGKEAQTKGWVLVQYPLEADETEHLYNAGVVPDLFIFLNISDRGIRERAAKRYAAAQAKGDPIPPSWQPDWVDAEIDEFHHEFPAVSAYYLRHYENLRMVDASKSKWAVSSEVSKHVRVAAQRAQAHAQAMDMGRAGAILDVCYRDAELQRRRGFMDTYCPVTWATKRELAQSVGFACRRFGAEFRGKFYHCAGQRELDMFLEQPTRYLARQRLPPNLPVRLPFGAQTTAAVGLGG